jgi:alkylation response protein AidB-like acyl-CoA dehydrogenase
MRLRPTGDGEVLDGCDPFVLHADAADVLLVSAQAAGEIRNVLVPAGAGGVRVTRARGFDLTRSICRVDFDGVAVPAAPPDWDAEAARQAARRGSELGALLVCADAIGSAQRLMEMTVAYAQSREVFGRALATYQAVKHACADMLCGLEGSREAALDAARRLQDAPGGLAADDATRSVHVAKSFAAAACSHIAGEALQLHGGIGFTWEHDLHLFLRRIKADEALFGTVAWHRDRLGRDAIAGALADG